MVSHLKCISFVYITFSLIFFLQIVVQERKRRLCGCGCCCFMIALFLLLFFLVPRTPSTWLQNLTNVDDGLGNSTTFYGTFQFKNNNYFSVKWSDPEIGLYWVPKTGTNVLNTCICLYDVVGTTCAIKLGEFNSQDSFSTNPQEHIDEEFMLVQSNQEVACALNMISASLLSDQILYTKGSVKAKGAVRNFGKINVRNTFYDFY